MTREFTYCEADISDLHKDAIGFRPTQDFWNAWHDLTPEGKQKAWDTLVDMLEDDNE